MKFKLLSIIGMLLFSLNVIADDNPKLNLKNPDVRKCLLDASKAEGWEVEKMYYNNEKKLVIVLKKENEKRIYISSK